MVEIAPVLQRTRAGAADVPAEVEQVREFLAAPSAAPRRDAVRALPGEGSEIPVHILGTSTFGAQLAGTLGLPYVVAAHFAPVQMRGTLAAYRTTFTPAAVLENPHAIIAAGAFAAETDAGNRRLLTSMQLRLLTMIRGHMTFLPPVDDIPSHRRRPQEAGMVCGMLAEAWRAR